MIAIKFSIFIIKNFNNINNYQSLEIDKCASQKMIKFFVKDGLIGSWAGRRENNNH